MSKDFAEELFAEHSKSPCLLPARSKSYEFIERLLRVLFTQFAESHFQSAAEISTELAEIQTGLVDILTLLECKRKVVAKDVTAKFFAEIPKIRQTLKADADAIFRGDPAANCVDEVIVAYPGFLAIAIYRVAHQFFRDGVPILPRVISEYAHRNTGIDIHPGAEIGQSFCIDHGTGTVIGETSVIGKDVKLYQGVTLGAVSVDKNLGKKKRHPTIEDHVVIYSNATILGGSTVIGHHSVIGGNVFVTESVPPFSTVYHTSEVKVRQQAPDWSI